MIFKSSHLIKKKPKPDEKNGEIQKPPEFFSLSSKSQVTFKTKKTLANFVNNRDPVDLIIKIGPPTSFKVVKAIRTRNEICDLAS